MTAEKAETLIREADIDAEFGTADPIHTRPTCPECDAPLGGIGATGVCAQCLVRELLEGDIWDDLRLWSANTTVEELDDLIDDLQNQPDSVVERWHADCAEDAKPEPVILSDPRDYVAEARCIANGADTMAASPEHIKALFALIELRDETIRGLTYRQVEVA